jgi:transposase
MVSTRARSPFRPTKKGTWILLDFREALVLIGAMGLSYEEATRIWHVVAGTMKSRINRARAGGRASRPTVAQARNSRVFKTDSVVPSCFLDDPLRTLRKQKPLQ